MLLASWLLPFFNESLRLLGRRHFVRQCFAVFSFGFTMFWGSALFFNESLDLFAYRAFNESLGLFGLWPFFNESLGLFGLRHFVRQCCAVFSYGF